MSAKKKGGFLSFLKKDSSPVNQPEGYYYEQIAASVGAGGWTIDFIEKKSYFDKQLRTILKTPEGYKPSFNRAIQFFDKDYHNQLIYEYENLRNGLSCAHDVKMCTYQNQAFWARVIGEPIFGPRKKVVGIRGIILNIDDHKKKEIDMENSLKIIEANNSRLFKFANYISHNLKLHVNNLELTSQLWDDDALSNDQKDLLNNYSETTRSLANMVSQLNEVVSIQQKAQNEKKTINLENILEKAKLGLEPFLSNNEAYIYSDFSEAPEISYIPDFMSAIMTTLIKDGVKNQHPERKPEVKIYSLEEEGKISIIFEDNGTGIVVEDDEHIYYNSRSSSTSQGRSQSVRYFIIKNQVEALGGTIEAIGKPGYGSKFIISLL